MWIPARVRAKVVSDDEPKEHEHAMLCENVSSDDVITIPMSPELLVCTRTDDSEEQKIGPSQFYIELCNSKLLYVLWIFSQIIN